VSGHDCTLGVQIERLPSHHAAYTNSTCRGLFASSRFETGQIIGHYTGVVKERKSVDRSMCVVWVCVTLVTCLKCRYLFSFGEACGKKWDIDAEHFGNEMRFINDFRGIGASPNCMFELGETRKMRTVRVVCIQPISSGQEILVDYGPKFEADWTKAAQKREKQRLEKNAKHRCVCGAPYTTALPYIRCDHCKIWHHLRCVGLNANNQPKGNWHCSHCQQRESLSNIEQYASKLVAVKSSRARAILLFDRTTQTPFVFALTDNHDQHVGVSMSLAEFEAFGKLKTKNPKANIYVVDERISLGEAAVECSESTHETVQEDWEWRVAHCLARNNESLSMMARELGVDSHVLLKLNKDKYKDNDYALTISAKLVQNTPISLLLKVKTDEYSAVENETLTQIAVRFSVDAHALLHLNAHRYANLELTSMLRRGTLISFLPSDSPITGTRCMFGEPQALPLIQTVHKRIHCSMCLQKKPEQQITIATVRKYAGLGQPVAGQCPTCLCRIGDFGNKGSFTAHVRMCNKDKSAIAHGVLANAVKLSSIGRWTLHHVASQLQLADSALAMFLEARDRTCSSVQEIIRVSGIQHTLVAVVYEAMNQS
jgi:hypothetical protein